MKPQKNKAKKENRAMAKVKNLESQKKVLPMKVRLMAQRRVILTAKSLANLL